MSLRLDGINPLAYMGVKPSQPPNLVLKSVRPTINDLQNINIGTFWLVYPAEELWFLISVATGVATWVQLYPTGGGGGGADQFPTDAGTANQLAGVLNVFGSGHINTTGAGNTVTIHLDGGIADSYVADAGSAAPSSGILNVFGGVSLATVGSGNTLTINLDGDVANSYHTNSGNATPAGNILNVLGAGTVVTSGSGNTITITGSGGGSATTYAADTGTATPSGNILNLVGGNNIVTSATGNTVTTSLTKGTNGQVLISATAGDPAWANLTAGANITITNGANSISIAASGGGGGGGAGNPSFLAYQAANQGVPLSGSASTYPTYTMGTLSAMTTALNLGGAFFPGDGAGGPATFTVPSNGIYCISANIPITRGNTGTGNYIIQDGWIVINLNGNALYAGSADKYVFSGTGSVNVNRICLTANITYQFTAGDIITWTISASPGSSVIPAPGRTSFTVSGPQSWQITPLSNVNATWVAGYILTTV